MRNHSDEPRISLVFNFNILNWQITYIWYNRIFIIDMDDFILRVEIDICSRSFSLLSENGDSRLIKCDTKEEFIRILRVCDELLLPDQVVYKELATQKDK